MTMEHIARSFSVSLHITHPHINPTEISEALGLTPHRMKRVGEPRVTLQGAPLEGEYQFSSWSHKFDVSGALELGAVLEDLIDLLQRHQSFFNRIVQEEGNIELFCGVFADGNWDEILSHSLMGKLAALHVDLRLDVYPRTNPN